MDHLVWAITQVGSFIQDGLIVTMCINAAKGRGLSIFIGFWS